MSDWRKDPGWALVQWDPKRFKEAPPDRPPPAEAELTGGGAWCAVFERHRCVATWARPLPMTKQERQSLRKRAESNK